MFWQQVLDLLPPATPRPTEHRRSARLPLGGRNPRRKRYGALGRGLEISPPEGADGSCVHGRLWPIFVKQRASRSVVSPL